MVSSCFDFFFINFTHLHQNLDSLPSHIQLTQESLPVCKRENYDLMQGPVHLPKLLILLVMYWPTALIGPNRPPWGQALPQQGHTMEGEWTELSIRILMVLLTSPGSE
jgi:hypothetical protein